ncbi:unnamed protein product, partial [Menidia menidia]
MSPDQPQMGPDQTRINQDQTKMSPGQTTMSPVIINLFIVALSFAYFSKALAGTYMKSSITQIERRFDLSSTQ